MSEIESMLKGYREIMDLAKKACDIYVDAYYGGYCSSGEIRIENDQIYFKAIPNTCGMGTRHSIPVSYLSTGDVKSFALEKLEQEKSAKERLRCKTCGQIKYDYIQPYI